MGKKEQNKESQNNSPKWYLIISVFLSIVALLVSFGSLYFSWRQTEIQKDNYGLELQENQPVFHVRYQKKYNFDKEHTSETEYLKITNVGREAKHIKITNEVLLRFKVIRTVSQHSSNSKDSIIERSTIFYIPIKDYFNLNPKPESYKGLIVSTGMYNNYRKYQQIQSDIKNPKNYHIKKYRLSAYMFKYVIIEYIDVFDNPNTLFYLNGEPISREEYDSIHSYKISKSQLLDNLTIENLKQIAKIK